MTADAVEVARQEEERARAELDEALQALRLSLNRPIVEGWFLPDGVLAAHGRASAANGRWVGAVHDVLIAEQAQAASSPPPHD